MINGTIKTVNSKIDKSILEIMQAKGYGIYNVYM